MVATASVRAGDVLRVLPGERVPVSRLNQAYLALICFATNRWTDGISACHLVAYTDRSYFMVILFGQGCFCSCCNVCASSLVDHISQ